MTLLSSTLDLMAKRKAIEKNLLQTTLGGWGIGEISSLDGSATGNIYYFMAVNQDFNKKPLNTYWGPCMCNAVRMRGTGVIICRLDYFLGILVYCLMFEIMTFVLQFMV